MEKEKIKIIENDQFARFVGLQVEKVEPGYAEVRLALSQDHLNGVGIVQGGVIFTLADYAFAAATNASGIVTVGINASISYFKPPKGKWLLAKAQEISTTKNICNCTVDVFDEADRLVARFNGTGFRKKAE